MKTIQICCGNLHENNFLIANAYASVWLFRLLFNCHHLIIISLTTIEKKLYAVPFHDIAPFSYNHIQRTSCKMKKNFLNFDE